MTMTWNISKLQTQTRYQGLIKTPFSDYLKPDSFRQDYGFEYSDDDGNEEEEEGGTANLENKYYQAKGETYQGRFAPTCLLSIHTP